MKTLQYMWIKQLYLQLSCMGSLSWARTFVGDLTETDHNVAGQVTLGKGQNKNR